MNIVVNDFAGHPFQLDLSQELARQGHVVTHCYCSTNATPHADFSASGFDASLEVHPIALRRDFRKYNPVRRVLGELSYGFRSARRVRRETDVVLAANVPVLSLGILWMACWARRVRRVLWLQDLQTGLAERVAQDAWWSSALRALGALEGSLIRRSDHVVAISPGFERRIRSLGQQDVTTIRNWAPLQDLGPLPKPTPWGISHGLNDKTVFLYNGTLGAKHRPELLIKLAEGLGDDPTVEVVVVSSSPAAAELASETHRLGLTNVTFLPFQPFSELSEVLAAADVLVALLDSGAAELSVPSKVLTYLCAGRAILAAMPARNDASIILREAEAGLIAPDDERFISLGRELRDDPALREALGQSGRRYATSRFRASDKTQSFLDVLGTTQGA